MGQSEGRSIYRGRSQKMRASWIVYPRPSTASIVCLSRANLKFPRKGIASERILARNLFRRDENSLRELAHYQGSDNLLGLANAAKWSPPLLSHDKKSPKRECVEHRSTEHDDEGRMQGDMYFRL